MPQIELPSSVTVKGLFLLDVDELKELDAILKRCTGELRKKAEAELRTAVKEYSRIYQRSSLDEAESKARADLKERYPFNRKKQVIAVYCKSGKTIKHHCFADIVECPEIKAEWPEKVKIEIEIANTSLSVELFERYPQPAIEIDVRPSDSAAAGRIVNRLRDWAEKKRRLGYFGQILNVPEIRFGILFISLFCAFMFSHVGLVQTPTGKIELLVKALTLLNKGVNEKNQSEAIGILLQYETGLYEGGKVTGVATWYKTYLAFVAGVVLLTS